MAVILSVVANYIPSDIAIVAILSAFGYILSSIDFLVLIEWLYYLKKTSKSASVSPQKVFKYKTEQDPQTNSDTSSTSKVNLEPKESKKRKSCQCPMTWQDCMFHSIMVMATVVISVVIIVVFNLVFSNSLTSTPFLIETILLYICIFIFIICKFCGDFQSVYLFYGLIRNPFFPKESISTTVPIQTTKKSKNNKSVKKELFKAEKKKKPVYSINHHKPFFRLVKYIRIILIRFCAPLLLCAVISIDCHLNKVYNDKILGFFRILIVLRAYRWVIF